MPQQSNRLNEPMSSRRHVLQILALTAIVAPLSARSQGGSSSRRAEVPLDVWKDPQCGCCKDWVTHLMHNGFKVRVHEDGNTEVRRRAGIPASLGSCHTALVGGYAIEGHVPAADIVRLLKNKPDVIGLAVPGMPIGSPGMDGPAYGGRKDRFEVLLVRRDGSTEVFRRYG